MSLQRQTVWIGVCKRLLARRFLVQFEALVKALTKAKDNTEGGNGRVVQGFCWTQFTDVEQEVNGLLTKDRKFKVAPEKIKAILDAI